MKSENQWHKIMLGQANRCIELRREMLSLIDFGESRRKYSPLKINMNPTDIHSAFRTMLRTFKVQSLGSDVIRCVESLWDEAIDNNDGRSASISRKTADCFEKTVRDAASMCLYKAHIAVPFTT